MIWGFFAGVRDWSEIYRYVMILAHFEVSINMALCYFTMKLEVFLNMSVTFKYVEVRLWEHPQCAIRNARWCHREHVSLSGAALKSRAMCVQTAD